MSQPLNQIAYFFREGNKLDGSLNFEAWKKGIYLVLVENEVMDGALGKVLETYKEKNREVALYHKGETRTQRILIESIKYHLIPFVAYLAK